MSELPSVNTIEMGLRMASSEFRPGCGPNLQSPEIQADIKRDEEMQKQFFQVTIVEPLSTFLHDQLHHSPISATCESQKGFLLAVMAKMFYAGWCAGRQEIIDAELSRISQI